MAQKHACGTMLEEKNKLIGELEKVIIVTKRVDLYSMVTQRESISENRRTAE